jgi:hypothetical protein
MKYAACIAFGFVLSYLVGARLTGGQLMIIAGFAIAVAIQGRKHASAN